MKAYLKAFGLWKVRNAEGEPKLVRANTAFVQITLYEEEVSKCVKALNINFMLPYSLG